MFPIDKQLHFFVGGTLMGFFAALFGVLVGAAVVVIVAAGKEVYDWFHKDVHTPDLMDFLATCLGGAFVATAFLI